MIDKPGIYLDIAPADYFADPTPLPSLTQSIAKVLIEKSPRHAQLAHPRLCPPQAVEEVEPYSSAKAIGDAAHAALIGRGKRIIEADFDDWRTKEARALRAGALAVGDVPILKKHAERVLEMVKAMSIQLEACGYRHAFRLGDGEVVVAWQEDGIWLRTMIDWISARDVFDYKTTALSVAPHAVVDRPSIEGWDIQAAMHERALDAIDESNAGRRRFFYVCQENELPYALTVVEISKADLDLGRAKLEYAIRLWRECMKSGQWPMYPAQTIMSRPRPWTESRWVERELEHHDRERASRPLDSLMGG